MPYMCWMVKDYRSEYPWIVPFVVLARWSGVHRGRVRKEGVAVTSREVFEKSLGMPWADPKLSMTSDGVFHYETHPDSVANGWIADPLAEAAMMRGMVEWLLKEQWAVGIERYPSGQVSAVPGFRAKALHMADSDLESLLLACQSLYEKERAK